MPLISDAFQSAPSISWLNSTDLYRRQELALVRSGETRQAVVSLSKALDSELASLRGEMADLRDEVRKSLTRECSAAAFACTSAVNEVQRTIVELTSVQKIEEELKTTKEQLRKLQIDHAEIQSRNAELEYEVKEASEAARAAAEAAESAAATAAYSAQQLQELKEEGGRHATAIQHIASMVTANSAEDEVTAEKLNARIDTLMAKVAEQTGKLADQSAKSEATEGALKTAVQHVANMVTANSAEDEETAKKLNERIDAVESSMRALRDR